MPTEQLINELQSFGVRLADPKTARNRPPRRCRAVGSHAVHDRRRDRDDSGPQRAGLREPLSRRASRRGRPQPHLARRRGARRRVVSVATQILRPHHRGRRSLLEDRDPARARRARHHRAADLHSLPEPHQDLSVLRHRPVARGGTYGRAQDAGTARRSRQGGRRARRCQAHGDDDGHAAYVRSRRRDPCGECAGRQSRCRPADPGAMRTAGRFCLV